MKANKFLKELYCYDKKNFFPVYSNTNSNSSSNNTLLVLPVK